MIEGEIKVTIGDGRIDCVSGLEPRLVAVILLEAAKAVVMQTTGLHAPGLILPALGNGRVLK